MPEGSLFLRTLIGHLKCFTCIVLLLDNKVTAGDLYELRLSTVFNSPRNMSYENQSQETQRVSCTREGAWSKVIKSNFDRALRLGKCRRRPRPIYVDYSVRKALQVMFSLQRRFLR